MCWSQVREHMSQLGMHCKQEHLVMMMCRQGMGSIERQDRNNRLGRQSQLEVKVDLEELVMLEVGLVVQEVGEATALARIEGRQWPRQLR